MDRTPLKFGFSPCPNDTFSFHAWVEGLVVGPDVTSQISDIETLNQSAETGEAQLTKLSVAALGRARRDYALLRAGGAGGYGLGPIVVTKTKEKVAGRVAVPGVRTTASLLLRLIGDFETVPMPFHEIEHAVLSDQVDCGVLIHEGRFTYAKKGLRLLADLGAMWEARMRSPVPLGAIAIRRDLIPKYATAATLAIRASVDHAIKNPLMSRDFVEQHAREMSRGVVEQHIRAYVNNFTREIDERAVELLLAWGERTGIYSPMPQKLSIFA